MKRRGERRNPGERVRDAWRASELERPRRAGEARGGHGDERDRDAGRERNERRERDERRAPGPHAHDRRPRVFDPDTARPRAAHPEAERARAAHAHAERSRGEHFDEGRAHDARSVEDGGRGPQAAAARGRHYPDEPARGAHAPGSQLYGVSPVLEALRARSRPVERITLAEGAHEHRLRELLELARAAGVPVRRAPRAELSRMSAGANHQGVVAVIAAAHYRDAGELLDALSARVGTDDPPLAVALDGVEDPRNLGAIIRTAECAGAHGVFVPERRSAGLTEVAAKAAAGALEYIPVARAANVVRLVEELKERGVWTVGAAAEGPVEYTDWDWTQPCALLLGGEGEGLRRLVRERCDALVRIPLRGRISSLNVSVAAAVLLYEAVRQRAKVNDERGTMNDEPKKD